MQKCRARATWLPCQRDFNTHGRTKNFKQLEQTQTTPGVKENQFSRRNLKFYPHGPPSWIALITKLIRAADKTDRTVDLWAGRISARGSISQSQPTICRRHGDVSVRDCSAQIAEPKPRLVARSAQSPAHCARRAHSAVLCVDLHEQVSRLICIAVSRGSGIWQASAALRMQITCAQMAKTTMTNVDATRSFGSLYVEEERG